MTSLQQIEKRVEEVLQQWNSQNKRISPFYNVTLFERGRTAGWCKRSRSWSIGSVGNLYELSFNIHLFRANTEDFMVQTIPHEVAHMICGELYPEERGHGQYWKHVMRLLDLEPRRCHSYQTESISPKRDGFLYKCSCRTVEFSSRRHNNVRLRGMSYRCNFCGETLIQASNS